MRQLKTRAPVRFEPHARTQSSSRFEPRIEPSEGIDTRGSRSREARSELFRSAGRILGRFLERHRRLVASCGQRLSSDRYHTVTRVCYDDDHERGLWKRWDPERGTYVFLWARCVYALCRRVQLETRHLVGTCTGFAGAGPGASVVQRMRRCGCPFEVKELRHVWLVEPRAFQVREEWEPGRFRTIRHGQPCEVLGSVSD